MRTIEKIMVAVDDSDYSLPSVQYAHNLAIALNARIILVSIYNERDYYTIRTSLAPYDPVLAERIFEENMDQRRKFIDELVELAEAHKTVSQKIVRVGIPHLALLTLIEEEKPDLLVMGLKGRSNLGDTIVGSCAQKMYRRSPIPVLSLRPFAKV
jgi:nucleotide-binding universal stress UspA family protein